MSIRIKYGTTANHNAQDSDSITTRPPNGYSSADLHILSLRELDEGGMSQFDEGVEAGAREGLKIGLMLGFMAGMIAGIGGMLLLIMVGSK